MEIGGAFPADGHHQIALKHKASWPVVCQVLYTTFNSLTHSCHFEHVEQSTKHMWIRLNTANTTCKPLDWKAICLSRRLKQALSQQFSFGADLPDLRNTLWQILQVNTYPCVLPKEKVQAHANAATKQGKLSQRHCPKQQQLSNMDRHIQHHVRLSATRCKRQLMEEKKSSGLHLLSVSVQTSFCPVLFGHGPCCNLKGVDKAIFIRVQTNPEFRAMTAFVSQIDFQIRLIQSL